jgi:tetratricopeptide (TPR) repeat protein
MHFKLKLVLLLLILLSCSELKSQNLIIYDDTKSESYLVKYISNPSSNQSITNYYIQEIAKSIPKMLNYTQYVYSYKQNAKITKLNPSTYNVILDIEVAKCSGDIYFKGFSMNDVIQPSFIDFDIKVFNGNNLLLNNFQFKQVPLGDIRSRIADFEFTDTTASLISPNTSYYLQAENKEFSYDANAINRFDAKRKLIEEYFFSDQLIANSLSSIQTINLENLEMINQYDIKLDEVEQELSKLYNKEFAQKLKLNIYDPINYMGKIESLSQQVYDLRFNINKILASLDKLYYDRALLLLKSGSVDKAIYNFSKSIEFNYYFCPAHYQLALIDYNSGRLDEAASRIKEVLTKMYPDYPTQLLVNELAQAINDAYLYEGSKLIKSEDYNEALVYLEKGKLFCSSTPGIKCQDQLFNSISIAKYGIFSSYLAVADKAVENDKLELSELYLQLAIKYQKENSTDIISKGEIDIVLSKLIIKYVDEGFVSNDQKKYNQALNYFNKAIELQQILENPVNLPRLNEGVRVAKNGIYQELLLKANELYLLSDYNNAENLTNQAIIFQKNNKEDLSGLNDAEVLMSKIKYQQYLVMINDGKNFILTTSYENALNKFEEAKQLEGGYSFIRVGNLDSLIMAVAKPLILKDIENGGFKVFQGDLPAAKEIIAIVQQKQTKYDLSNDLDITSNLNALKDKIFTEECKNAQAEYDRLYSLSQQKVSEKLYIEAEAILESAINNTVINVVCGISSNNAENLKFTILPAANFQKQIKNIEEAFKNNDFGLVIDKYIETEKYFQQFQLGKFGLAHSSLFMPFRKTMRVFQLI